ncbi:MAG: hypothetical protein HKP61_12115 [Dactylosporangium sp.]|nr:hypothetical protein [Dactylosporangium sp.]NNJ61666.1 hypothetical protein [Dactylosporangium sp.]
MIQPPTNSVGASFGIDDRFSILDFIEGYEPHSGFSDLAFVECQVKHIRLDQPADALRLSRALRATVNGGAEPSTATDPDAGSAGYIRDSTMNGNYGSLFLVMLVRCCKKECQRC